MTSVSFCRYMSVRYEDFVMEPVATVSRIYKFIGIPFSRVHQLAVKKSMR